MKLLVIGSWGREHALVWKLAVMARGEGAPSGATAGPPFPPPATSGFSLGSALRAAGVEPPPPADLGGAATVAATILPEIVCRRQGFVNHPVSDVAPSRRPARGFWKDPVGRCPRKRGVAGRRGTVRAPACVGDSRNVAIN